METNEIYNMVKLLLIVILPALKFFGVLLIASVIIGQILRFFRLPEVTKDSVIRDLEHQITPEEREKERAQSLIRRHAHIQRQQYIKRHRAPWWQDKSND